MGFVYINWWTLREIPWTLSWLLSIEDKALLGGFLELVDTPLSLMDSPSNGSTEPMFLVDLGFQT